MEQTWVVGGYYLRGGTIFMEEGGGDYGRAGKGEGGTVHGYPTHSFGWDGTPLLLEHWFLVQNAPASSLLGSLFSIVQLPPLELFDKTTTILLCREQKLFQRYILCVINCQALCASFL